MVNRFLNVWIYPAERPMTMVMPPVSVPVAGKTTAVGTSMTRGGKAQRCSGTSGTVVRADVFS